MKTKYEYRLEQDQNAGNPRDEFDNLSTFYAKSTRRYITGGKNDLEFQYREDLEEVIRQLKREGAVIVEGDNPNTGKFYAVIERDSLKKEYLDHGYSMRKALYHARRVAQGEIEIWNAWADGEVYGYIVTDTTTGEEVDSCWGFYGEKYAEEEAKSAVKYLEAEFKKELALYDARMTG